MSDVKEYRDTLDKYKTSTQYIVIIKILISHGIAIEYAENILRTAFDAGFHKCENLLLSVNTEISKSV